MSSRIMRSADATGIEKHEFRRAHESPQPSPRRRPVSASAVPEQGSVLLDTEIQTHVETARRQGYSEGVAHGAGQAMNHLEPVIRSLKQLIEDLGSQRRRLRAEAEEDTVKLAIAIARRVLHREIATDPEAMLGLVKAAFAKLNARDTHRLRVSPADAEMLQEHRARLQFPPALNIVPDGSLPQGSAIFETTRGEMDACVDSQLGEIDRGLTDVLRRRTS